MPVSFYFLQLALGFGASSLVSMKVHRILTSCVVLFLVVAVGIWHNKGSAGMEISDGKGGDGEGVAVQEELVGITEDTLRQPGVQADVVGRDEGEAASFVGIVTIALAGSASKFDGVVDGEITIALGDTASVQTQGGEESLVYTSYVMSMSGTVVAPTALQGEKYVVSNGKWTMDVPMEDMVVVALTVNERSYEVVSGGLISKSTKKARIVARKFRRVQVSAVDHGSGEPIANLLLSSEPRIPFGQAVSLRTETSGSFKFEKSDNSMTKTCPKPRESAVELASGGASPTDVEQFAYPQTLWVGSEGYQWKAVEVGRSTRVVDAELRKSGGLVIRADTSGMVARVLSVTVSRGGAILARWDGVRTESEFRLTDIGVGECIVALVKRGRNFRETIAEKTVQVEEDGVVDVHLMGRSKEDARVGAAKIRLSGIAPELEESTIQITPVDSGYNGLQVATRHRFSSLLAEGDGNKLASFPGLPEGNYFVVIEPHGISRVLSVQVGKISKLSIDLSGIGLTNFWPDFAHEGSGELADPQSLSLRWGRSESDQAYNYGLARGEQSGALTREGCWTLRTIPGDVIVHLIDKKGRIVHREALALESGISDIVLTIDDVRPSIVRVVIDGLSGAEMNACSLGLKLGADGNHDNGITPATFDFVKVEEQDLFSATYQFVVSRSSFQSELSLYGAVAGRSLVLGSDTSDIESGTRQLTYSLGE